MPSRNWNNPWLAQNAERNFPLTNTATRWDVTKSFQLPNDFIVGMYLGLPFMSAVNPANFFLKVIRVGPASVALEIGYDHEGALQTVATCAILKAAHTFGKAYPFRGLGNFYDCSGHVIVGSFEQISKQPPGSWTFGLADGAFEPDVIRPQLRGISSIRVSNGLTTGSPITGDIVLRPGRNIRMTTQLVDGSDPVIVVDAIQGEGLNENCFCEGAASNLSPIKTINNVRPNVSGNLTLAGSDCLTLAAIANGLRLQNPCSEPCCGCKELKVVTDALENFGQQAATLENFVTSLESKVEQMGLTVLGSRIGDRNCNTCPSE